MISFSRRQAALWTTAVVSAFLLCLFSCWRPHTASARQNAGDIRFHENMAVTFSRLLTEISEKMVTVSSHLTEDIRDKQIEHLLIFNELLLIKTIVNYENQLFQSLNLVEPKLRRSYRDLRARNMMHSKQQVQLSLERIRGHTSRLVSVMKTDSKTMDMKGLSAINELQQIAERILMLFEMSMEYLWPIAEE